MKYFIFGVALLAAFFFAYSEMPNAKAQTFHSKCDLRSHIVSELKGAYQESIIAHGLGLDKAVLEVLASKDGSWTLLRTQIYPSGSKWSCIIYAGKSWQLMKPLKGTAL